MIKRSRPPSKTSLVSFLVFYITFTILASIFFWLLVHDIASGSKSRFKEESVTLVFTIMAILIIVVSIFLTFWIIFKLLQLKKRDLLQGGLKLRLMGYFTGFAFLITIPQVVLSIMIVATTTDEWLPKNTENIILQSRHSLLKIREQQFDTLKEFSRSRILNTKIQEMLKTPSHSDKIWKELRATNSIISSLQLFSETGEEILFEGNESCKIQYKKNIQNADIGELPVSINKNKSIFRYLINIDTTNPVKAIISMVQPAVDIHLITDLTNLSNHYKPLIESRAWIGKNITIVLLLFILLLNLASIYISLYLSNLIILPIVDIEQASRKVAGGDFKARLYPDKSNNFTLLAHSFNKMVFDLERLQKNSSHDNKMKAWQDIAKRMAHEINNPLTPIRMSAERMLRRYKKDPTNFGPILEKSATSIITEVETLSSLLHDFRAFSRLPEPNFSKTNLYNLIDEVKEIYSTLKGSLVEINLSGIGKSIELNIDKSQMKQVFSNLIKNSIEAIEKKGIININTSLVSKQNIKYCRIIIEDNGKGIPQELLENIFTPYFTTKKEGTGLGLSIIERIIFVHDGKIRVVSQTDKGTTFIIDLPMES